MFQVLPVGFLKLGSVKLVLCSIRCFTFIAQMKYTCKNYCIAYYSLHTQPAHDTFKAMENCKWELQQI